MKRIALIVIMVAVFSGCEKKPVAVVNGEDITQKMFDSYVAQRMRDHQGRGAAVSQESLKDSALQQMISETLMLQEARQRKLVVTDMEINNEVDGMRRQMGEEKFRTYLSSVKMTPEGFKKMLKDKLMLGKLIEFLVPSDSISEEEIKHYYKESPTPFFRPETINVRFIQAQTEEIADGIVEEIKAHKGAFDAVAENVANQRRALVSAYGWTRPEFFSESIAEALKEIKPGGYGGPFKGKDGFYILSVKEKKPKGIKTLDESRDEIRSLLLEKRRQAAVAHWIAEKKQTASIVVN